MRSGQRSCQGEATAGYAPRVEGSAALRPAGAAAVLVGGCLLAACGVLAALGGPASEFQGLGEALAPAGSIKLPGVLDGVFDGAPRWLTLLAAALVAVLALVILVPLLVLVVRWLWLALRRLIAALLRPAPAPAPRLARTGTQPAGPAGAAAGAATAAAADHLAATRDALAGSAAQAARRLRAADGRDAAREIIRCWESIEATVATCGLPRRRSDTPTEFTRAVLASLRPDAGQLTLLLALYGRARFGGDDLEPADLPRARRAFDRLHRDLAGVPAANR